MHELKVFLILFGVGSITGFINIMAGGGSSLTLPTLIFLGLDSATANGTNRIALLLQNVSALISFRQEQLKEFKTSVRLAVCALPGAIIGAVVAVRIDNLLFQKILAFVILAIMVTVLLPRPSAKNVTNNNGSGNWIIYPVIFAIGFYGGFIQVGTGFLMIASLSYILKMDLVHVNLHKITVIGIYTIPALLVFLFSGNVDWFYGLSLAAGNAFGGWWSAKVSVRKGEKVIRIVLIIAMVIMAMKLLRVF